MQRVLDNLNSPAFVYNAQHDLIAAKLLRRALSAPHFYADWPLAGSLTAAMLRLQAGRDPLNGDLTALIRANCPPAAHSSVRTGPSRTSTSTTPDARPTDTQKRSHHGPPYKWRRALIRRKRLGQAMIPGTPSGTRTRTRGSRGKPPMPVRCLVVPTGALFVAL